MRWETICVDFGNGGCQGGGISNDCSPVLGFNVYDYFSEGRDSGYDIGSTFPAEILDFARAETVRFDLGKDGDEFLTVDNGLVDISRLNVIDYFVDLGERSFEIIDALIADFEISSGPFLLLEEDLGGETIGSDLFDFGSQGQSIGDDLLPVLGSAILNDFGHFG